MTAIAYTRDMGPFRLRIYLKNKHFHGVWHTMYTGEPPAFDIQDPRYLGKYDDLKAAKIGCALQMQGLLLRVANSLSEDAEMENHPQGRLYHGGRSKIHVTLADEPDVLNDREAARSFCEEIITPAFDKADFVLIDFNGVAGYKVNCLYELFGGLRERLGSEVLRKIGLVTSDHLIKQWVQSALTGDNNGSTQTDDEKGSGGPEDGEDDPKEGRPRDQDTPRRDLIGRLERERQHPHPDAFRGRGGGGEGGEVDRDPDRES